MSLVYDKLKSLRAILVLIREDYVLKVFPKLQVKVELKWEAKQIYETIDCGQERKHLKISFESRWTNYVVAM